MKPYEHGVLRKFDWFYCILRGAKRRGEKLMVFTVYHAAQSEAAKIRTFLHENQQFGC